MRTLAIALLLCVAPLAAAEMLTDAQVLAKLDDASAAEARWILNAKLLALGAVGVDGRETRAGIAYRRLLAAKNPRTFEVMVRSCSDVATCYGIEGLIELAPDKLLPLLPGLALRNGLVTEGSGDVFGTTSPLALALREAHERQLAEDTSPVAQAWEVFLDALPARSGVNQDRWAVVRFADILGTPPKRDPPSPAAEYVHALRLASVEQELRNLAVSATANAVSRRLAIEWLADWVIPQPEPESLEIVWTRKLDERAVLDLQIEAVYWEMVADGRERGLFNLLRVRQRPADVLSTDDWTWLEQHANAAVRDTARRLRGNVCASWKVGDNFPTEPEQQRQALSIVDQMIRKSKVDDTSEFRRAQALLESLLAEQPKLLTVVSSDALCKIFKATTSRAADLQAWFKLAADEDFERFLLAARFLCVSMESHPRVTNTVKSETALEEMLKRLWKEADGAETGKWECRELLARILECMSSIRHDEHRKSINAVAKWFREYARAYASPRTPVPGEFDDNYWLRLARKGEGRPHSLIEGVRRGDTEFLPADEQSNIEIPKQGDQLPALVARMREAVAKLD